MLTMPSSKYVPGTRLHPGHAGATGVPGTDEDVRLGIGQVLPKPFQFGQSPPPNVLSRAGCALTMNYSGFHVGEPQGMNHVVTTLQEGLRLRQRDLKHGRVFRGKQAQTSRLA